MKVTPLFALSVIATSLAVSGCQALSVQNLTTDEMVSVAPSEAEQPEVAPATSETAITPPSNFIVEIDDESIDHKIKMLTSRDPDREIRFDWGIESLNDSALASLNNWIADTQPSMVAVEGTSGDIRYQELAEQRTLEIARVLKEAGIAAVLVPFDPKQSGGRALMWSLDEGEMALAKVSLQAIMVVP